MKNKSNNKQDKSNQKKISFWGRINALIKKSASGFTVRGSEKPILTTIGMLVAVNAVVLLIAAAIAMQLGEFDNYFSALITAGTWLVAPNAIINVLEYYGIGMTVLAFVVLVTGMILFTGTIIAVITTSLRTYINKKSEAKGQLILSDHIVILNYNTKVTAMLIDLMYSKCACTVLILSDKTKEFIKEELAAEIASLCTTKPSAKLKLMVRKGCPESIAELEEICIDKASGILIVESDNNEVQGSHISATTYSTVKLVMKLANFGISPTCPIGVEADRYKTVELIRDLNKNVPGLNHKHIQAFSYNRKLGQFLALSILCPPLSRVLTDLLSNTGCIFRPTEETIEDYLSKYKAGVPVVTLDKTYVLTPSAQTLHKKRYTPFSTARLLNPSKIPIKKDILKLYIIGKNKKTNYMLEALATNECPVEIKQYDTHDIQQFVQDVIANGDENTTAVILSDDSVDISQYDANVFMTLIEFSKNMDMQERKFKIIAELLEPDNQKSVEEFSVHNIIISTRIISFFATKLLSDPTAELFYEDVFTHSKAEMAVKFDIWIDAAECLFDFAGSETLEFSSHAEFVHAAYYGSGKKRMPLGCMQPDGSVLYFCNQMDTARLVLHKDDPLVYVNYL